MKYKLTDKQFDDLWSAINRQAIDDYMTLRRRHIPKSAGYNLKELECFFNEDYPNDDGKGIFKELKNNCDKIRKTYNTNITFFKIRVIKKKRRRIGKTKFLKGYQNAKRTNSHTE